jgi:hypothetical protein
VVHAKVLQQLTEHPLTVVAQKAALASVQNGRVHELVVELRLLLDRHLHCGVLGLEKKLFDCDRVKKNIFFCVSGACDAV